MMANKTVSISESDVLRIVVWDLIDKYEANIERQNAKWIWAFENVLRYYIDEDELYILGNAIHGGDVPDNPLDLFDKTIEV